MARKRKRPRKRGRRRSRHGPDSRILFLARRGVPGAQFRLGQMYLTGEGWLKYDPAKAARCLRAAAEQDHVEAQALLAELYHEGDGVEQDFEEAARWLRAAAKGGDEDAPLLLGMMYADLEADMDEDPDAESCLEVAAAAGHLPARYLLSALRGEDEFPEPDEEEFRQLAEVTLREAWRGNPEAQFFIANAYLEGLGVPKDDAEAMRWLRAAANQGEGAAAGGGQPGRGGRAERPGGDVPEGEAVPNVVGHLPARYLLSALRGEDEFPEPDEEEFRQLAEVTLREAWRGNPEAQFFIANAYLEGLGVPKDDAEAMRWLRAAANQGEGAAAGGGQPGRGGRAERPGGDVPEGVSVAQTCGFGSAARGTRSRSPWRRPPCAAPWTRRGRTAEPSRGPGAALEYPEALEQRQRDHCGSSRSAPIRRPAQRTRHVDPCRPRGSAPPAHGGRRTGCRRRRRSDSPGRPAAARQLLEPLAPPPRPPAGSPRTCSRPPSRPSPRSLARRTAYSGRPAVSSCIRSSESRRPPERLVRRDRELALAGAARRGFSRRPGPPGTPGPAAAWYVRADGRATLRILPRLLLSRLTSAARSRRPVQHRLDRRAPGSRR